MPGQRNFKYYSPVFIIFNRKKRSPSLGTAFRGNDGLVFYGARRTKTELQSNTKQAV